MPKIDVVIFSVGTLSLLFVIISVLAKVNCLINRLKGLPQRPSGLAVVPAIFILPAAVILALLGKFNLKVVYIWGPILILDILMAPKAYKNLIRALFSSDKA